jgi:hypothetical protein
MERILVSLTFYLVIVALMSVGSQQVIGQTASSGAFLTYRNGNYGFTMKYPQDWTFNDTNPTNGGVTFLSPDRDGAVSVRVFSTNHTMEQYENTFLKTSSVLIYAVLFFL